MPAAAFSPRALAAVVVVVVAAVAGTGATVVARRSNGGAVRYRTAAEMAERAGCANTFTRLPAYAGVNDAGQCRIDGVVVEFRTFDDVAAAMAWSDGARHARGRHHPSVFGDGWVAETADAKVAAQLVPALTAE